MFNIAIIEDSKMYRKILERTFQLDIRYNVFSSETIADVEKILEDNEIDLILLDINLPDGKGQEVIEYVRNKMKNEYIYIIAVTSEVSEPLVLSLYDLGADQYFKKPYNLKVLKSTIDRIYQRELNFPSRKD